MVLRFPRVIIVLTMLAITLTAVPVIAQDAQDKGIGDYPFIELPEGYQIEKYASGLTFPTSLTWDDQGRMYVAEAGGGLNPEQLEPSRIMLVERGNVTEVVNLTDKGVFASVVGLTWHNGAFYFTHRNDQGEGENSLTGSASRWMPGGEVEELFSGIIDSQSEHQINDIKVGPDGRMYVTVGAAGNAGVVDPSIAPWVMENPGLHPTPCEDIVLTGRNFKAPNFMTMDDPDDTVMTGAYVPFGTETTPGQVIEGTNKCGGSILVFDPENAEATIQPYAWGFRNLLGLAWDHETGEMYVAQNGYDIRGSRPVQDEYDPTYRVREGEWYGVPDYSAAFEPLTDPKFEPPDEFQAEVFVNGESVGKTLDFVIDHEASGLDQPDKSLILGLHEFNSSPSFIDVAPESWGEWAGQVFVAEWGDLAPPTNPLLNDPAGYQVTRVDPSTGEVVPFVRNTQPGPASMHGMQGQGMERPFDVKFGPDGAMYIVDYGVVTIDMERKPPYNYMAGTGTIWKVTRTSDAPPVEDCNFFEETGHQVCDEFLTFWTENGGLEVFGYPLTGAFMETNSDTGETYLVQYFERERFELHPENAGTVYEVLLGRLGAQILELQGRDWMSFEMGDPSDPHYVAETGHSVAPMFWDYWSSHGLEYGDPGISFRESLLLFGYPLSEPMMETNMDGDTVLTQWFERAAFEYHPDNEPGQQVLLRRLGAELLEGSEPTPATYQVTIENLTNGQPFSPPVAATHSDGVRMFRVGELASDELAAIAQDGNPVPMFDLVDGSNMVTDAVNVGMPLTPSGVEKMVDGMTFTDTVTFEITAMPGDLLSLATMLICTNDGFLGLDSVALPASGTMMYTLDGYDAGVEENTEVSQDIVDPCSGLGPLMLMGDPDGNDNEGVATTPPSMITHHPGIQGNGELSVDEHGWTDPVARVTITRLPGN